MIHILQHYSTDTGKSYKIPQCESDNPEECRYRYVYNTNQKVIYR